MNTTKVKELVDEYAKFHSIDDDQVDLKDQIQLYEALIIKIEQAGLSFYEVSRRFHLARA